MYFADGIKTKNVPQSYYNGIYKGLVTDEEELYELQLWLDENNINLDLVEIDF